MAFHIGWFSTGRGPGSRNLLTTAVKNIEEGSLLAEISFVFTNREKGEAEGSDLFHELVKSYGIDLVSFSSKKFKPELREKARKDPQPMRQWRIEYDREVLKRLKPYEPQLTVLAGYMLIVGEEMCERYDMINLHPAAPGGPAGTWKEVIWKLIGDHSESSGVMMHLVTKELDKGPPITYCTFPLRGGSFDALWEDHLKRIKAPDSPSHVSELGEDYELFKEIRRHGATRELPLIVETLRAFATGKIRVSEKRILVDSVPQSRPHCLTEEIEALLTKSTG
jgi:folate-dependent phosphoribosylglycinamide formyltransferase PurN